LKEGGQLGHHSWTEGEDCYRNGESDQPNTPKTCARRGIFVKNRPRRDIISRGRKKKAAMAIPGARRGVVVHDPGGEGRNIKSGTEIHTGNQ